MPPSGKLTIFQGQSLALHSHAMLFRVETREHIFSDNANGIIQIKTEQPIGVQVLNFRGFGYARQDLIEPHVDEISLASKSQLDYYQQVGGLQRFLRLS